VLVVRVGDGWRAELPHLRARRSARTLDALDRQVRQLVAPDKPDYEFRTGDPTLDQLIQTVRVARRVARTADRYAREVTALALDRGAGLGGRDLGVMLGLSHQRVHQLRRDPDRGG